MQGFSSYEVRTRDRIRDLIRAGGKQNCDKAREIRRKFLDVSTPTRIKRQGLLRTIRFLVTVVNGTDTKESQK
jgi:hypothetical protein